MADEKQVLNTSSGFTVIGGEPMGIDPARESASRFFTDPTSEEWEAARRRAKSKAKARAKATAPTAAQTPTPKGTVTPAVYTGQSARAQAARLAKKRDAASAAFTASFTQLGFDEGEVRQWLKGVSPTDLRYPELVAESFRKTPMWEKRFGAAVRARQKNGKSYLNEGEIIALEDSYKSIFSTYGIPESYWQQDDLQALIGEDVSPDEVRGRVEIADAFVNNQDPAYVKSFKEYYGIGKKDIVGYVLNRKKGITQLQQQAQAAEIGAEALGTGMDTVGKKFAEKLVDKDISRQEARQAFDAVSETEADWKNLARISGEKIGEKGLIKDELGLDKNNKVGEKKKRLASQERARFGGAGGGTGTSNTSTSGSF